MTTLSGCRDHFRYRPVFAANIHVAENYPFILKKKIRFVFSFLGFVCLLIFNSCCPEFVCNLPVCHIWKPFCCILVISLDITSVKSILSLDLFTSNIVVLASKQ